VDRLKVSADGRVVTLTCSGLRAGFVHQLVLGPLQSASGQSLRYDRAYYTLNRIPTAVK
jgi:hypothetical protein